ncbi:MAG: hypothetical protein ASARMPREDX12_004156 [Alectoria sarmentosa]|nr:MAG: hypothetical protein ASARMPREDX12_004156 [Alectoria sarmentosa]
MTKRKGEEEKAAGKVKRRVPFTAPKDAAIKAMYETTFTHRLLLSLVLTFNHNSITRNASCSPLLRLPLEVRDKIWTALLGDRLIHLEYLNMKPASTGDKERQNWRHVVCKHNCPEKEVVKECTQTFYFDDEEHVWQQPHYRCDIELAYNLGPIHKESGRKSMHLTALRVCRQIYDEGSNLLWSTNTFSFNEAATSFHHFMDERTTRQKRCLRRLRLQMDWAWEEDKAWNRALGMTLIRSLTGLRSLRLQINHSMEAAFYQKAKARGNVLGLFQTGNLDFVHKMAILPLTEVDVFVGDRSQQLEMDTLWTAEDRMEYAEGIRKILLNSRGAEIYAQNQKELKDFHRQDREKRLEYQALKDVRFCLPSELAAAQASLSSPITNTQKL